MAKGKRAKCEHNLSPVYMRGCPHCVVAAMSGFNLMRGLKMTTEGLLVLLRQTFKTDAAFAEARDKAEATVREQAIPAPGGESKDRASVTEG